MRLALTSLSSAFALALGSAPPVAAQAGSGPPGPTPGSFDLVAMDKSADPCLDFYQYACGGWRKGHPIPGDRSRWGRFDELAEGNREVLRRILEKAADPKAARSGVATQVGDHYAACMDEAAAEKAGVAPLRETLERVAAIRTRADLTDVLAFLHRRGMAALFAFYASPSLHDSALTVANVDQGGISLPDRDDYVKADPKSVERREKLAEHVERMFTLAGDAPEAAAADAKTVVAIETELARGHLDRVARRDPRNRDHPMSRAALLEKAPALDFARYFEATGAPAFAELNVANPGFFEKVDVLLGATSLADWKTYLRWRVLREAAPLLSSAFVNEDFRFNEAYLRGTKELEPRWRRCVRRVDEDLGEALGRLYVEETFGAEGKARMAKMIAALDRSTGRNGA